MIVEFEQSIHGRTFCRNAFSDENDSDNGRADSTTAGRHKPRRVGKAPQGSIP